MFSGEKPEASHLRIFGFPVYIHVPKEKRSKLQPSGRKGIFVGYSESLNEYRVYIYVFRQIETNKYVIFDEDTNFNRSRLKHVEEVHDEDPEALREIGKDVEEHDP